MHISRVQKPKEMCVRVQANEKKLTTNIHSFQIVDKEVPLRATNV